MRMDIVLAIKQMRIYVEHVKKVSKHMAFIGYIAKNKYNKSEVKKI